MFFAQEEIAFQIIDVFAFEQTEHKCFNSERHFDALSFRFEADTVIEANGRRIHLGDHSLCFVPANVDYVRATNHERLIVVNIKIFNYCSDMFESFVPSDWEKYELLFRELLSVWEKKEPGYKHGCAVIFCRILKEMYGDTRLRYEADGELSAALRYINQNCLNRDFSLKQAAECVLLSESYFRRKFKEQYHISPKRYVINYRLKHAASLILTGYFSLQEVSEKCGYEDYKHFSVEFKKFTGVSPSQYSYNQPRIGI